MKPLLAVNINLDKLKYPLIGEPKIDGVRGLNVSGCLLGRSLKTHANVATTEYFSRPELTDFDGELTVGTPFDDDVCRVTTSALSTIDGNPFADWNLFDYLAPNIRNLEYIERHDRLKNKVLSIGDSRLKVVEYVWIADRGELEIFDSLCIKKGYEGSIFRNPYAKHKDGRSGKELELLRLKQFIEEEAIVIDIVEGKNNHNEIQVNELGRSFRSSHKENMTASGQIGALICRLVKDIFDPFNPDVLLLPAGLIIEVAAGKLTQKERVYYFQNKEMILGKLIKFKLFPKGIKDKPRFPTFQSFKIASDIGV